MTTQKGWFNPYLFASGRRPVIPRNMKPDVVFCHGPFENGDYDVGQTLISECSMVACFSKDWTRPSSDVQRDGSDGEGKNGGTKGVLSGMLRGKGKDTTATGENSTDGTATTSSSDDASPKPDKKAAKQAAKDAKRAEKTAKQAAKDEAKRVKKAEKGTKSDAKKTRRQKRMRQPPLRHRGTSQSCCWVCVLTAGAHGRHPHDRPRAFYGTSLLRASQPSYYPRRPARRYLRGTR